jgi:hypothetical protein
MPPLQGYGLLGMPETSAPLNELEVLKGLLIAQHMYNNLLPFDAGIGAYICHNPLHPLQYS